jgi:hypothetical protein
MTNQVASMPFRIQKHIIPCQHIRQHDGPSTSVNEPRLSVKQYSPSGNPIPAAGDVTIVAAHGNGFVKVVPLPRLSHFVRAFSLPNPGVVRASLGGSGTTSQ